MGGRHEAAAASSRDRPVPSAGPRRSLKSAVVTNPVSSRREQARCVVTAPDGKGLLVEVDPGLGRSQPRRWTKRPWPRVATPLWRPTACSKAPAWPATASIARWAPAWQCDPGLGCAVCPGVSRRPRPAVPRPAVLRRNLPGAPRLVDRPGHRGRSSVPCVKAGPDPLASEGLSTR